MEGNGMRKIGIGILCLLTVIMIGSPFVVAQDDSETKYQGSDGALCIPMGTFTIGPPEAVTPLRSLVDFPHSRHFSYSCTKCHHKWDGESKLKNCTTSGCHDQVNVPEKPLKDGKYTAEAIKYYKYAYHNQCRDCHRDLKNKKDRFTNSTSTSDQTFPETIPTGCVECHPKS
ncbi:MAG: hypothetical protein C4522_12730 [Desulfobacteraceae bacterium]|nr:MAG: hypothetical protein C4522_12730 [Desulfobacteraceae bacterium]